MDDSRIKVIDRPYLVLGDNEHDFQLKVEVRQNGSIMISAHDSCCEVELTKAEGLALQRFIRDLDFDRYTPPPQQPPVMVIETGLAARARER